ncbi:MarR family winged helix-turn-helix transcriptional regulator [Aeromicrobium choanae]|uniref:DNA-binding transcriptional regulator, MarR family n=1 Tax=Aeromicrobium choanae TaxID=1736691 RepID=A0A1T4Z7I1_9ACTN|nr:MarR family transcriptional regulator [Aeromicrobium choanae]SKB09818.1 DNA-binding transcriptional regulator, MarR family [Aeromicrobium choanae]
METSPLEVAAGLRELANAIVRRMPRREISRAAAGTLHALEAEGPQRITALAEREAVSQPAITNLVQRLEAQDLVSRSADPADARASLISITAHGSAVLHERRVLLDELIGSTFERLSPDDRAAIVAALPALTHFTESHESR